MAPLGPISQGNSSDVLFPETALAEEAKQRGRLTLGTSKGRVHEHRAE